MIGLFIGAICIAFAPIFVKLIDLSPTLIGFHRCFIGALVLLPFVLVEFASSKRSGSLENFIYHPKNKKLCLWLSIGAVSFALDLFVWHRALIYAGAGIGTILANTQVFYLGVVGVLFFGEKLNRKLLTSILLAFFGLFLLVRFQDIQAVGEQFNEGVIYGFLTGIAYASFILILRFSEKTQKQISTTQKLFHLSWVTSILLYLMAIGEGDFQWALKDDWVWVLLLASLPQSLGWILITKNLPKVDAGIAGLILLTQPVLATLMGIQFFDESYTFQQLLGAAITIAAIFLGTTRNYRVKTSVSRASN